MSRHSLSISRSDPARHRNADRQTDGHPRQIEQLTKILSLAECWLATPTDYCRKAVE